MKCDNCGDEFSPEKNPGALLFSSPVKVFNGSPFHKKYHICQDCEKFFLPGDVGVDIRNQWRDISIRLLVQYYAGDESIAVQTSCDEELRKRDDEYIMTELENMADNMEMEEEGINHV